MESKLIADITAFIETKAPRLFDYPLVYKCLKIAQKKVNAWTELEESVFNSVYVIFAFMTCTSFVRRQYVNLDRHNLRLASLDEAAPMSEWMKSTLLSDYRNGYASDVMFARLCLMILKRRAEQQYVDQAERDILTFWISCLQKPPSHFNLVATVYDYIQNTLSSIAPLANDFKYSTEPYPLFVKAGATAGMTTAVRKFITLSVYFDDRPDVSGRGGLRNPHILAFIQAPYGKVQNRIIPASTRLETIYSRVRGNLQKVADNKRNTFRLEVNKDNGPLPSDVMICFQLFYEIGDGYGDYQSVANGSIRFSSISKGVTGAVDMRTFANNSDFSVNDNVVTTPYQTYRDCILFVSVDTNNPIYPISVNIPNTTPVDPVPRTMHGFFTTIYEKIPNIREMSQSIVYPCLPQFTAPIPLVTYTELPAIEPALVECLILRTLNAFDIVNRAALDTIFREAMTSKAVYFMAREMFVFMFNLGAEMFYLNDRLYGHDADKFANARETNSGDCDDMGILGYQTLLYINKHPELFSGPIFEFSRAFFPAMVVVSAKSSRESRHLMLHMITMMFPRDNNPAILTNIIVDGTVRCMNMHYDDDLDASARASANTYASICSGIAPNIFKAYEIGTRECSTNICDKYEAILSVCSEEFAPTERYMRINKMDAFGEKIYTPRKDMCFLPIAMDKGSVAELVDIATLIPPIPEMDTDTFGDLGSEKQKEIESFMMGKVLLRKERQRSGTAYTTLGSVVFSLRSADIRRNNAADIKSEFMQILSYSRSRGYGVSVQRYDILPNESTFDVIVTFK